MEKDLLLKAEGYTKKHRFTHTWQKIGTVLAAIVVFCTTYMLVLPAITWDRTIICTVEEHTHSDACYTETLVPESSVLTCSLQEHIHGDACYAETRTLICTMQESAGHTHGEGCYDANGVLTCTLVESAGHTHTAQCWSTEKTCVCTIPEHIHTESCYTVLPEHTEMVLTCSKAEHIHAAGCYDAPPAEPDDGFYCGFVEHSHNESCYFADGTLRCTVPEHIHTRICESDPNADLAPDYVLKKEVQALALGDNWAENVITIARSQLGYTESSRNFILDENGNLKGYSRYGAWYGLPYGDWCAMFASFCIENAGVRDFPVDSSCENWIIALRADANDPDKPVYYYPAEEAYEPVPGDLVFYDWDDYTEPSERVADHVGIVVEVTPATESQGALIKTIEGNWGAEEVCCVDREINAPYVQGFARLPKNPDEPAPQPEYVKPDGEALVMSGVASVDIEYLADGTVRLRVVSDAVGVEQYHWQWQRATASEVWADIEGATGCVYEYHPGEDEKFSFYRAIGTLKQDESLPEAEIEQPVEEAPVEEAGLPEEPTGQTLAAALGRAPSTRFARAGAMRITGRAASGGKRADDENAALLPDALITAAISPFGDNTTFWREVTEIDDTAGVYLIVRGDYAVTADNAYTATKITLTPLEGSDGIYHTSQTIADSMKFSFSAAVGSGASTSVLAANGRYIRLGSSNMFGDSRTLTVSHADTGWYFSYNGNYLHQNGSAFDRAASQDLCDMKLYKQAENPGGFAGVFASLGAGNSSGKPSYAAYLPVSGAKTGETTVGDVAGTYVSDPATSQLESRFAGITADDGKVLVDKSVVFGDDDYGAFSAYADNTFGVTLSVLGQDYRLKTEDQVKIPMDVVFIIDASGSMTNRAGTITRNEAVVNAVNSAMTTIMGDNEENRAGVVLYSSGGNTLLALDHYTAGSNGQYLTYSNSKIRTASNLKDSSKNTIAQTYGETNSFKQANGTYTQYGIALADQMLRSNANTTYTAKLYEGTPYEYSVTVQRKPVIILLSDGDPTHCTNEYSNVLKATKHYGSGVYPSTTNNKGIQGYNTILSANYYKRAVSEHYKSNASFYTIGMGIYETGYTDMSAKSSTGDCYKRAVLNPTADNIEDLLSPGAQSTNPNGTYSAANTWSITCQMLNQLLAGSYSGNSVTVDSATYAQLGTTSKSVPVVKPNPYAGDYSYSDGAYFGNLDTDALKTIFDQIIKDSRVIKAYGYMLRSSSVLRLEDEIGAGMELKGAPVLRFNGKNYSLTVKSKTDAETVYTCPDVATTTDFSGGNGTQRSYDLSKIDIRVTRTDGVETVRMNIPENMVPTYTPEENSGTHWYYEALPLRLIYQVGLTEAAETEISALKGGQTKSYYTNAWGDNISASSTENPHEDNPYYNNVTYEDGSSRTKQYAAYVNPKASNSTGTAANAESSSESSPDGKQLVTTALGNNGKLSFTGTGGDVSVSVSKVWAQGTPQSSAVSVYLYRVSTEGSGGSAESVTLTEGDNPLTLNADNSWTGTFTFEPEDGYRYYISEAAIPGTCATYSTGTATDSSEEINVGGTAVRAVPVAPGSDGTYPAVTVTNHPGTTLPETGGPGTLLFTVGGLLLAGIALVGLIVTPRNFCEKEKMKIRKETRT